jgi:uncharacterized membrane protein YdbT with pleckstrin-like domain
MYPSKRPDEKEPKPTMSQSFFKACLLILFGIVALWIAVDLLAHFWGWLLLAAGVAGAVWVAVLVVGDRRNRW